MKNHKGVVPCKTRFSWAAGHFKLFGVTVAVPGVPASLAVHSVLMGPQYKSGVFPSAAHKGRPKGLVATGLSELVRVWLRMSKEVNSSLPYTLVWGKGKRRVPCFWGCDFYSLSALSSSGGLHSLCSYGHSVFWAEKGAQFILSWISNCLGHM